MGIIPNKAKGFGLHQLVFKILNHKPISFNEKDQFELNYIKLPKQWNKITFFWSGYTFNPSDVFLNRAATLAKHYDLGVYTQVAAKGLSITKADLKNEKACFSFLLYILFTYKKDKWKAICEKVPDTLERLFSVLNISEIYISRDGQLYILTIGDWVPVHEEKIFSEVVPIISEPKYLLNSTSK